MPFMQASADDLNGGAWLAGEAARLEGVAVREERSPHSDFGVVFESPGGHGGWYARTSAAQGGEIIVPAADKTSAYRVLRRLNALRAGGTAVGPGGAAPSPALAAERLWRVLAWPGWALLDPALDHEAEEDAGGVEAAAEGLDDEAENPGDERLAEERRRRRGAEIAARFADALNIPEHLFQPAPSDDDIDRLIATAGATAVAADEARNSVTGQPFADDPAFARFRAEAEVLATCFAWGDVVDAVRAHGGGGGRRSPTRVNMIRLLAKDTPIAGADALAHADIEVQELARG